MTDSSWVFKTITALGCGAIFNATQQAVTGKKEFSFWAHSIGFIAGERIYEALTKKETKQPTQQELERQYYWQEKMRQQAQQVEHTR